MRIVVADSVELQENHLQRLKCLGDIAVFSNTPEKAELARRLESADVAILGWSKIDEEVLASAKRMKMIALWSTGYDYVDIAAARTRGIAVANVPGYAANTIAEFVICNLIALARRVPSAHRHVQCGLFDWKPFIGSEILGKTLGIVGMGAIGSCVAKKAALLGMNVVATTRHPSKQRGREQGVRFVSLPELLAESDAITIHSSLNSETRGLFGRCQFAAMKSGAFLLNTARSEIVDQTALEEALRNGQLGGVALDVIEGVPLAGEHIFMTHPNVILSPHCAFFTREALGIKSDICVANVESFVSGKPINIVN